MDALEQKLVERISDFLQTQGYTVKPGAATVSQMTGEFLSTARNVGKRNGKFQAEGMLREVLKKADGFCEAGEYDKISSLIDSFEELVKKETDSFNE